MIVKVAVVIGVFVFLPGAVLGIHRSNYHWPRPVEVFNYTSSDWGAEVLEAVRNYNAADPQIDLVLVNKPHDPTCPTLNRRISICDGNYDNQGLPPGVWGNTFASVRREGSRNHLYRAKIRLDMDELGRYRNGSPQWYNAVCHEMGHAIGLGLDPVAVVHPTNPQTSCVANWPPSGPPTLLEPGSHDISTLRNMYDHQHQSTAMTEAEIAAEGELASDLIIVEESSDLGPTELPPGYVPPADPPDPVP
jgi:hypothetical protein